MSFLYSDEEFALHKKMRFSIKNVPSKYDQIRVLKTVKNTQGGVLPLVKLQASACTFT